MVFNRKTKDWREDDYVLLEDLKKKPVEKELKEEKQEEKRQKIETVKERLEKIYKKDRQHNSNVKQRLEKLQNNAINVPKFEKPTLNTSDYSNNSSNEIKEKVEERKEKIINPDIKNIEKAIKEIENVKAKMDNGDSYLSLFYDLKKAEKEFLTILQGIDLSNLSENVQEKIKKTKSKIRLIK